MGKRITGTQRFAIEITKHLIGREPVRVLVARGVDLPEWLNERSVIWVPSLGCSRLSLFLTYWVFAPFYLNGFAKGVVWSPCNVGSIFFRNNMVTIHDMSVLFNPKWFSRGFVALYRMCFAWYSFTRPIVTTDSLFSKSEIQKYYPALKSKVSVVGCGVSAAAVPSESSELSVKQKVPAKFILSVASIDPRKNLSHIVSAWGMIPFESKVDFVLVLVGGGSKVFSSGIIMTSSSDVIKLGYVNDDELAALYKMAHCVVAASSYEGFGLPIVEAAAYRTPVICSNIPVFVEVGGEDVTYFNLGDLGDLSKQIALCIGMPKRTHSGGRNYTQTWTGAADSIWGLYESSVGRASII